MKHEKKKQKKGLWDYLRLLLLIACVCTFVYSGYQLLSTYLEYENIDAKYTGLRQDYAIDLETGYKDINWEELLQKNGDVIAWIEIPDTNIDYPVLKGETNDSYLYLDIDKNESKEGSIFVDALHTAPFEEPNTILYGHNMKNDSMFGHVVEYVDAEYAAARPYIYIYFPDGTVSKYKLISVHQVDARSDIYVTNLPNLNDYYPLIEENNLINVEYAQDQSPIITLSTCVTGDLSDMRRIVLHAALEESGIHPKTQKR